MKRLREFFDDSSLLSEEEDSDGFEMAMTMILNDKIRWLRLGSQFGHWYIKRDTSEGHAKLI
jgi:hypothetical protein